MVVAKRKLDPLPLLDEGLVLEECTRRGINHKHAYTMWRHIVAKGVTDVDKIPGLPKALYRMVSEKFVLSTSKLEGHKTSADRSTTKLLIRLQDGALVETVIMRYGRFELKNFPADRQRRTEKGQTVFASKERATVCVSSQVGCQMGCTFCATGTMGLLSNLTAGEILEQLYHANTIESIRNVVFMGMGEPLDNYDAVVMAVRGMTDVRRFSLSPSRIAISTVGVVPKMLRMAEDIPEIGLAVSLHAPTQELRAQIVPTAKAWHIDRIVTAMDNYIELRSQIASRRSHVLIEYVLIDEINSSEEVAHQLGQLLQDREVIVNVIPYNPTDVPHDYRAPSAETVERFNTVLREYELRTIVRQELGQDVNAACGQLVISSQKTPNGGSQQQQEQQVASCATDIEELFGIPEEFKQDKRSLKEQRRKQQGNGNGGPANTKAGGENQGTKAEADGMAEKSGDGAASSLRQRRAGGKEGVATDVDSLRRKNDARAATAKQRLKTTLKTTDTQARLVPGLDNRVTYVLLVFFAMAGLRLLLKLFALATQQ